MKNEEKNYVAYIHCENLENVIHVTVNDLITRKQINNLWGRIPAKDVKKFINDIPTKYGNFKSIILSVFTFHSDEYKTNLEFCNALRAQLNLINVSYQFIRQGAMMLTVPIYAANITVNAGENVATATLINSSFEIFNFEFTGNGYLLTNDIDVQSIPYDEVNDDVASIREKLTSKFNPKELIIVADGDDRIKLEKMEGAHFVTCSCQTLTEYTEQLEIDYSKWMLDKSSVKTLLLPKVNFYYSLVKRLGDKFHREDLAYRQVLPFTKTLLLPKLKYTYALLCTDRQSQESLLIVFQHENGNTIVIDKSTYPKPSVEQIPQNEKYHGIKFSIEIDINNFPTITFRPMILKAIRILQQTLNEKKMEGKIPVIGFFGNLSVICLRKEDANYEFLEEWGGMYGCDLYISFDEEKPKYGEAAAALLKTKPTFVVYDLLKIMQMPPTEIEIDKTWHFDIINVSENEVLIEFDNFDGQKSSATPQFLMALLLKQHLKAIKNEVGKKPKKVGFCFFEVDDSVKERLKNQIIESFELLKIEHQFINI